MASKAKSVTKEKPSAQESAWKHVAWFVVMMILTAISFVLVGTGQMGTSMLIPAILILAALQVVIQLFTFMHLSERGSFFPLFFMGGGILVAATAIVAMLYWV
ncbi:hypothetical protein GCM10011571_06640 [Marinithermofilum abyssi]|uniref:Cytochrome c oxidase subunit 4 n=1 Tax=Marinithermofilum abyssi TaxID=1571185 RepID=A0A8J2VGA7_9BACL|nr:cytochrome C oxidase subunit IV family protein [Marinithermofilum abyssi]GGE08068.1 hypothetical protein GCM10011571_06640 [Marinithermofilum abyssi]